jgi:hypothetical protein
MPKLLEEAAQAQKEMVALAAYGLSDETKQKLDSFAIFCRADRCKYVTPLVSLP